MDRQKFHQLSRKLTGSPFFPVLFISKAIEEAAYFHMEPAVRMSVLAVLSTILWLYTSEDVAWGLKKVKETAEDVADDEQNT